MKTTKTIDTIVREKLKYYQGQESSAVKRFLTDNKRTSRDSLVRIQERIQVLKEILELL